MSVRRRKRKRLDDLARYRVEQLALFGFSYRAMAEMVLGTPAKSNSDEAKRDRNAIAKHLSKEGLPLRSWRDCLSPVAEGVARRALKTKTRKRA